MEIEIFDNISSQIDNMARFAYKIIDNGANMFHVFLLQEMRIFFRAFLESEQGRRTEVNQRRLVVIQGGWRIKCWYAFVLRQFRG